MTLAPEPLAAAWYVEEPPEGWWVGHGDLFAAAPYPVRDTLGFERREPVLAVCAEHPCDTANEPRPPRVRFVRAWYLDELLALRPKLWEALPQVAQGTHLDFWLLPPWPGRWDVDILLDFRDQFTAFADDVRMEDRLTLLRDEVRPAFVWRLLLREGRVNPPYPVAPFSRLPVITAEEEPEVARPTTIAPWLLEQPLRADEAAIGVR